MLDNTIKLKRLFIKVAAFLHQEKTTNFLFWLACLILTGFLHYNHYVNGDEGVILNGAWNLINHQRLYSDFFEFIAPGGFYLVFGAWKIFGVSFLTAKILATFFVFLGAVGLFKTGQLIIKNKLINFLIPLFFILMSGWWWIINHNLFNLVFLIWSEYFFIRGLYYLKNRDFVISGLLAGLSVIFLQQKSLIFIGFLFLFLIFMAIEKKKRQYLQSDAIFIVASLLPLFLFCFWPLNSIFYNLFQYPFLNYISANRISYLLFGIFIGCWFMVVWALSFIKEKSEAIRLLVFVQLGLLCSAYPLPDIYHLTQIMFPLILLGFYLIWRFFQGYKSKIIRSSCFIIFIIFLWALFVIDLAVAPPAFLDADKNKNKRNKFIDFVTASCPGRYLYSGPFLPSLYFETRKLNPTAYSILLTSQATAEQFNQALIDFKKNSPECAILGYSDSLERFNHVPDNVLENYIQNNYHLIYQVAGEPSIYKKNSR
ncbi:MAG: hypothetical protein WCW61_04335 [Patescibacteria group bacterium]